MEILIPAARKRPVKARLVNWLPPGQARGRLWSVLKNDGAPYRASASSRASTQNPLSKVFDSRQDKT